MTYEFGYYVLKSGNYISQSMGARDLEYINSIVTEWIRSDYDLHTFAGIFVKNLETGQELDLRFVVKNDWRGLKVVDFPPPLPSIQPRSTIEI